MVASTGDCVVAEVAHTSSQMSDEHLVPQTGQACLWASFMTRYRVCNIVQGSRDCAGAQASRNHLDYLRKLAFFLRNARCMEQTNMI